jgi:hypothetical protein
VARDAGGGGSVAGRSPRETRLEKLIPSSQRNSQMFIDPSPALPDFLRSGRSGTGSTRPREYN